MAITNFLDSFDQYSSLSHIPRKPWTGFGHSSNQLVASRFGDTQAYQWEIANAFEADFGGSSTPGSSGAGAVVSVGFSFKHENNVSADVFWDGVVPCFQVRSVDGNFALVLKVRPDGRLGVHVDGNQTYLGTVDPQYALHHKTWYFIEFKAELTESIDPATPATSHRATFEIWIEGQMVLQVINFDLLTFYTGPFIRPSRITPGPAMSTGHKQQYGDFYVLAGNPFGCAAKVIPLYMEDDGFRTEFDTPGSPPHFQEINEVVLNTANEINTFGQDDKDLFIHDALAGVTDDIIALQYVFSGEESLIIEEDDTFFFYLTVCFYDGIIEDNIESAFDVASSNEYALYFHTVSPLSGLPFDQTTFNAFEYGSMFRWQPM